MNLYVFFLILGVNTLYRLFCLFLMVGKGLKDIPEIRTPLY